MPINPLAEFFKRRKAEKKFATAGPGKTLAASTSSSQDAAMGGGSRQSAADQQHSSARQAAAEAAMKRFNQSNSGRPAQRPKISAATSSSGPSKAPVKTTAAADSEQDSEPVLLELPVVDGQVQRNVQIYSTDELTRRIKQPDIDDDFFRLTVEDAKLFKQRYDEERARNEILKTSEMRRREAEARQPTKNFARLRVKLPNNMVVEASFMATETMGSIRDWLVAVALEKTNFDLKSFDVLMGLRPLKEPDFAKTVKELGLIPATTLTIVQKSSS